jgi:hypothetical protein
VSEETVTRREIDSFQRYIFGTIDRLVESLAGLGAEELNWRPPAPASNSLYAITLHVLGNTEENLLSTLCGIERGRDRDAEFAARGTTGETVRERWRTLRADVEAALASVTPADLDREREHPRRRGGLTGREVLLVVARHAAEHWGEAQLTHGLMRARSGGQNGSA